MNRKKLLVFLFYVPAVLLVTAMVGYVAYCYFPFLDQDRTVCQKHLRYNLASKITRYAHEHDGKLPQNLWQVLDSDEREVPYRLRCPGNKAHNKDGSEFDYFYIYWPQGLKNLPARYPIAYDKKMSHHRGKGINVLSTTNRPEHLKVFFDQEAKWLQQFAKDHPEYDIPLPEDLKK